MQFGRYPTFEEIEKANSKALLKAPFQKAAAIEGAIVGDDKE
jgi:hypothetical protein